MIIITIQHVCNEFMKSFLTKKFHVVDFIIENDFLEGRESSYDFSEEFGGTLFRLPLRTFETRAVNSKISSRSFEPGEILELFQDNNDMLFLRNIEICSLYHMKDNDPQLIWQLKINNIDSRCQEVVDSIDDAQIYQLDIEKINNNVKVLEIWLLCTGGHDDVDRDLRKFSNERQLKVNIE